MVVWPLLSSMHQMFCTDMSIIVCVWPTQYCKPMARDSHTTCAFYDVFNTADKRNDWQIDRQSCEWLLLLWWLRGWRMEDGVVSIKEEFKKHQQWSVIERNSNRLIAYLIHFHFSGTDAAADHNNHRNSCSDCSNEFWVNPSGARFRNCKRRDGGWWPRRPQLLLLHIPWYN